MSNKRNIVVVKPKQIENFKFNPGFKIPTGMSAVIVVDPYGKGEYRVVPSTMMAESFSPEEMRQLSQVPTAIGNILSRNQQKEMSEESRRKAEILELKKVHPSQIRTTHELEQVVSVQEDNEYRKVFAARVALSKIEDLIFQGEDQVCHEVVVNELKNGIRAIRGWVRTGKGKASEYYARDENTLSYSLWTKLTMSSLTEDYSPIAMVMPKNLAKTVHIPAWKAEKYMEKDFPEKLFFAAKQEDLTKDLYPIVIKGISDDYLRTCKYVLPTSAAIREPYDFYREAFAYFVGNPPNSKHKHFEIAIALGYERNRAMIDRNYTFTAWKEMHFPTYLKECRRLQKKVADPLKELYGKLVVPSGKAEESSNLSDLGKLYSGTVLVTKSDLIESELTDDDYEAILKIISGRKRRQEDRRSAKREDRDRKGYRSAISALEVQEVKRVRDALAQISNEELKLQRHTRICLAIIQRVRVELLPYALRMALGAINSVAVGDLDFLAKGLEEDEEEILDEIDHYMG